MPIAPPSGVAVIQGASRGIGAALSRALLSRHPDLHVVATSRNPDSAHDAILTGLPAGTEDRFTSLRMDVTKEEDIARAAAEVEGLFGPQCVRLLFNVSGVLHAEKSLAQVSSGTLHSHFLVNAFGPILTTKHFAGKKLLYGAAPKREFAEGPVRWEGSVVANMSARTGSIGDNRLGGWYSYRASKSALNQLTVTAQSELSRKNTICVLLHPGTVATEMSKDFTKGIKHAVFTPDESAGYLLDVIKGLGKEDGGRYLDFKGETIVW